MDVAAFLARIYPAFSIKDERANVWVEFWLRKHHPLRCIALDRAVKLWLRCPRRIRIFHLVPRLVAGIRHVLGRVRRPLAAPADSWVAFRFYLTASQGGLPVGCLRLGVLPGWRWPPRRPHRLGAASHGPRAGRRGALNLVPAAVAMGMNL